MSARSLATRFVWTVGVLLVCIAKVCFSETYEPTTVEDMIARSTLIVVGEVTNTYTKTEVDGNILRYTTVNIQETVKASIDPSQRTIVIESCEGRGKGEQVQLSCFRPRFETGQYVLVFLLARGNRCYEVTGSFRGKLDVRDGMIEGTRTPLGDFVREIRAIADGRSSTFGIEMPSPEYQMEGGNVVSKIAHTGDHLDGQFYGNDSYSYYPPPHSITFHINPDGATDEDSVRVPFADLRTALLTCCSEWNDAPHSYIDNSVTVKSTCFF